MALRSHSGARRHDQQDSVTQSQPQAGVEPSTPQEEKVTDASVGTAWPEFGEVAEAAGPVGGASVRRGQRHPARSFPIQTQRGEPRDGPDGPQGTPHASAPRRRGRDKEKERLQSSDVKLFNPFRAMVCLFHLGTSHICILRSFLELKPQILHVLVAQTVTFPWTPSPTCW